MNDALLDTESDGLLSRWFSALVQTILPPSLLLGCEEDLLRFGMVIGGSQH
jgi:hypothetical protein